MAMTLQHILSITSTFHFLLGYNQKAASICYSFPFVSLLCYGVPAYLSWAFVIIQG
jgi:hypothetical protein